MAEVRAFRAVRYGEAVAADLGRLIAPPYDVARPDLLEALLERSPYNMVHLEHVRPDPGDDPHALAAERYRRWRREGVLTSDPRPAIYRYDHTFTIDEQRRTRRGIFALVGLAAWDERVVLPHEGTYPGPVAERHRRLRTVRANLSPIYLLARDPSGAFRALLDAQVAGDWTIEATDPDGEVHRLTTISDPEVIHQLRDILAGRRLYVADGHHRYEAALAYRDERRAAAVVGDRAASDYVLALISDAGDPNVVILPTHRLVQGIAEFDPAEVRRALGEHFALDRVAVSDEPSGFGLLEAATREPSTVCVALFAGESGAWRLRSRAESPHNAILPPERSAAWRALPTAILEHVVLGHLLDLTGERRMTHVAHTQDTAAAVAAVQRGEVQAAFLVRPSTVDELIAVADAGDRMPPKSTYFNPKVPAGLVIHDLDEGAPRAPEAQGAQGAQDEGHGRLA